MATEGLRDIVARLNTSAGALAALAAALDSRASGIALDPPLAAAVGEVVDALGASGPIERATRVELRALLGEIRALTLTGVKLLFPASRGAGWAHTEPAILEAAGEVSAAFPHLLQRAIAPSLDGLADRLSMPDASFLDVGVGVAALSIEMARLWPNLRVVGIDPWGPALALARERVRAAGLAGRIELRQQAGEDLADTDAFDLAWIPSVFVPEDAVEVAVRRVHRALRPGGWLIFPMMRGDGDGLPAALARLRTAMFGGFAWVPDRVEALLRACGFIDVRTQPVAPGAVSGTVVGRRAGCDCRTRPGTSPSGSKGPGPPRLARLG
jgi:SAM-dependent methyltransferase